MAVILRYFSEFGYLPGVLRNSSRSLSHLLMSSCLYLRGTLLILLDCSVLCGDTEKFTMSEKCHLDNFCMAVKCSRDFILIIFKILNQVYQKHDEDYLAVSSN